MLHQNNLCHIIWCTITLLLSALACCSLQKTRRSPVSGPAAAAAAAGLLLLLRLPDAPLLHAWLDGCVDWLEGGVVGCDAACDEMMLAFFVRRCAARPPLRRLLLVYATRQQQAQRYL